MPARLTGATELPRGMVTQKGEKESQEGECTVVSDARGDMPTNAMLCCHVVPLVCAVLLRTQPQPCVSPHGRDSIIVSGVTQDRYF